MEGKRIIALLDEAAHLPLKATAAGSVPSTYAYLLQAAQPAAQEHIGRGSE
jgi:hypothetical protein